MLTEDQYNVVKEMLVERMSKYRRNSFKLRQLYEIMSNEAREKAYIDFTYQEFREMFIKECVNGNIPRHKFTIAEEGFLDRKNRVPYANIKVETFK